MLASAGLLLVVLALLLLFRVVVVDASRWPWFSGAVAFWHHPATPGAAADLEEVQVWIHPRGHGPLYDEVEYTIVFLKNSVPERSPSTALVNRALAELQHPPGPSFMGGRAPGWILERRAVAADFLSRGAFRGVVVDHRARAWNIVHAGLLVLLWVFASHVLAAAVVYGTDVPTREHRLPPALRRWCGALALAVCTMLPATAILWFVRHQFPYPWWPYPVAPLGVLVIAVLVCLPMIAARLRRASLADDLLCTACLYDLRDLPDAGRCPECGQEYERRATVEAWRAVRKQHPV